MTKESHKNFLGMMWLVISTLFYFSSMYLTGSEIVSSMISVFVAVASGFYIARLVDIIDKSDAN